MKCNIWQWGEITGNGENTIKSEMFKGDISPIIFMGSSPVYWAGAGISHDPVKCTLTWDQPFNGIICFQYKDLDTK